MGDVTISTKDTTIYYPSDWLVEGGPPFDTMSCPKPNEHDPVDDEHLKIIYNADSKYFGVVAGGHIVMESKDRLDIATYIKDYVEYMQNWLAENEG